MNKIKNFYEKERSYEPAKIYTKRKWWSYLLSYDDRFDEVAKLINELLENKSGLKVLDLGCGDGVYESMLSKCVLENNFFYGVDISKYVLNKSKRFFHETKVIDFDRDTLPFRAETFDLVILSEILEHLFFPEKVIEETHRVLKTDGYLIVTVPNVGCLQNRVSLLLFGKSKLINYSANKQHIRFYSLEDCRELFEHKYMFIKKKGVGSLIFYKWLFPVFIPIPRFLQIIFNRFFVGQSLCLLLLLQKKSKS